MKRLFSIACLLIVLTAVVCGSTALAKGTAVIQGKIVDSKHGQPIMSVVIALYQTHDRAAVATTQTGKDGSFRLEGLPSGQYRLYAAKSGYRSVQVNGLSVATAEHLVIGFPIPLSRAALGVTDPIEMLARCSNLVNPGETADVYVTCSSSR